MRRNSLAAILALAFMFVAGCSSSGGGTTVTVLGYTVTIKTAPPTTAQVGASIPIAFTVTENESDGSSKPASGKTFTVAVTAGGGTVSGAASTTLTTAADGSASLTWILGPTVGAQTVRGSVSSDHFLDISVTATAIPVSSVAVTLATPSIPLGTAGDQATAVLKDAGGNVLVGRTVTWQSSTTTVATVSTGGVITTVGVGTSTITATSEGQSGGALLTVTQSTWNAAWHLRQQITVTTTTAGTPAGYSVAVQFDHASLVTAGKALASGNDVRVVYWTGSSWVELDRVLDPGSAWNTATTTIWFMTVPAITASSVDNNYYVYYSNPAATNPPANKSNVFLFADDFESGNLSKWTHLGLWTIDNTLSHAGTFALRYPAESSAVSTLLANPALNVDNVYFDAWWYRDTPSTGYDIAQAVREDGGLNGYGTRLYLLPPFGLTVEKSVGGIPTTVAAPAGAAPAAGTWNRVGTAMFGSTFYLFVNGTLQTTASGQTELASGNVGFGKIIVPPGASWWLDDVVARKYVNPEPTSAPGAEENAP